MAFDFVNCCSKIISKHFSRHKLCRVNPDFSVKLTSHQLKVIQINIYVHIQLFIN